MKSSFRITSHLKRYRFISAFSLVELSVVIALMSILVTSVLVARHLIESATVNRIFEDVRHFKSSISLFHDIYTCLPGNCSRSILVKHKSITHNLGSGDNGTLLDKCLKLPLNGEIQNTSKRTCMMLQLHAGGWIKDIDLESEMLSNLDISVGGVTMPRIKGSLAIDYATVEPTFPEMDKWSFPIEASLIKSFNRNDMIVVRLDTGSDSERHIIGKDVPKQDEEPGLAGISSRRAKSISSKFGETDKPFGRTIVAGREPKNTSDCHNGPPITANVANQDTGSNAQRRVNIAGGKEALRSVEYHDSVKADSCIMAFLMERFN